MSRLLRWTVLLAGALAALALWAVLPAHARAISPLSRLRVDFIDVGQGDAALITSPTGKTVLIDGGPHEASEALVAFLQSRLVGPLDLIVLTHRHADHLGGLRAAVDTIGARLFMDAPLPNPGRERERLMRALDRKAVPVRDAERGRAIDLGGGATITLLSPPEPPIVGTRSDVNANSVVLRLDFGNSSFLFMGDAETATERWLLNEKADVHAQVLKVAHHGSSHSSTARFLEAVQPAAAVISVGANNDYHHPAPGTLRRLERVGARVFRTDVDGLVTFETDGRQLSIHATNGHEEDLSAP